MRLREIMGNISDEEAKSLSPDQFSERINSLDDEKKAELESTATGKIVEATGTIASTVETAKQTQDTVTKTGETIRGGVASAIPFTAPSEAPKFIQSILSSVVGQITLGISSIFGIILTALLDQELTKLDPSQLAQIGTAQEEQAPTGVQKIAAKKSDNIISKINTFVDIQNEIARQDETTQDLLDTLLADETGNVGFEKSKQLAYMISGYLKQGDETYDNITIANLLQELYDGLHFYPTTPYHLNDLDIQPNHDIAPGTYWAENPEYVWETGDPDYIGDTYIDLYKSSEDLLSRGNTQVFNSLNILLNTSGDYISLPINVGIPDGIYRIFQGNFTITYNPGSGPTTTTRSYGYDRTKIFHFIVSGGKITEIIDEVNMYSTIANQGIPGPVISIELDDITYYENTIEEYTINSIQKAKQYIDNFINFLDLDIFQNVYEDFNLENIKDELKYATDSLYNQLDVYDVTDFEDSTFNYDTNNTAFDDLKNSLTTTINDQNTFIKSLPYFAYNSTDGSWDDWIFTINEMIAKRPDEEVGSLYLITKQIDRINQTKVSISNMRNAIERLTGGDPTYLSKPKLFPIAKNDEGAKIIWSEVPLANKFVIEKWDNDDTDGYYTLATILPNTDGTIDLEYLDEGDTDVFPTGSKYVYKVKAYIDDLIFFDEFTEYEYYLPPVNVQELLTDEVTGEVSSDESNSEALFT